MFRASLRDEITPESGACFLLPGFSGTIKEVRDRTIVMTVEIYADESGGDKQAGRYLTIAGLESQHSRWKGFERDWRIALTSSSLSWPFHMKDFVQKYKLLDAAGQNKLLAPLADVINSRVRSSIHISLDVEAFNAVLQPVKPSLKIYDNWVAGVLRLVWLAASYLWRIGHRERFRIVFDEKTPQQFWAQELYANVREILDYQYPFQASIMPNQLDFETDDNVPPLQAADLYAWCLRYSGKDGVRDEDHPYNPLLKNHLQSVSRIHTSEYVIAEEMHPFVRTAEILAEYRNGARDPSLIKEPLFGVFT